MSRLQKYSGVVEKGIQLGRELGFPTANLYISEPLAIDFGVYTVGVAHDNKQYYGVANYGIKPSLKDNRVSIEVYIFDFSSIIYGEQITIDFIEYLRKEKKFNTIEDLKEQIGKDVQLAKSIIANL